MAESIASGTAFREMALPGAALSILRRSLREEVGALPTVHALQAAGYEAGREMVPALLRAAKGRQLRDLPPEEFWALLQAFFLRKGWGRIVHRTDHPAVGILVASDWAESDGEGAESQPTCAFTSGVLSSLLSWVAGDAVGVLETRCRSRGDDACHFVFGSEEAIHRLYAQLLQDADFDRALSHL